MTGQASPWAGRKVLVTGCSGFLGGAVVRELLAAGAGVVGLVGDQSAGEFARHGLAGRVWAVHGRAEDGFRLHSAMAVHEVGAVFHLTAADPNRPDRGAAAVIEAARRYDPRTPVVVARPSSPPPLRGEGLGEGLPVPPVPLGVARFGELFGPGDRKPFRVVPAALDAVLGAGGLPPSGDTPRDFVPVADAARACLRLAEHLLERPAPRREDVTFRSGWAFTDRAMAAAVREVFAGRPAPATGSSPPNPLGWSPATTFADALAETIAWHRGTTGPRHLVPTVADAPRRAAA